MERIFKVNKNRKIKMLLHCEPYSLEGKVAKIWITLLLILCIIATVFVVFISISYVDDADSLFWFIFSFLFLLVFIPGVIMYGMASTFIDKIGRPYSGYSQEQICFSDNKLEIRYRHNLNYLSDGDLVIYSILKKDVKYVQYDDKTQTFYIEGAAKLVKYKNAASNQSDSKSINNVVEFEFINCFEEFDEVTQLIQSFNIEE